MADSFTEVSRKGLGSRLGESIKGVLVGIIMFLIAFPLLFWNEGRAVKDYKTLKEGLGLTVSVEADAVNEANEGALIHLSGLATTTEELRDAQFGVVENAIRLVRHVEMYQWVEEKKEEKVTEVGGSERTETTYEYDKKWVEDIIDSSDFRYPDGHKNPERMRFEPKTFTASRVTVGAFTLSDSLKTRIHNEEKVTVTEVPPSLQREIDVVGENLYYGKSPADPAVGDLRIHFTMTPPTEVSIVAQQLGTSFGPYQTEAGGKIELLKVGRLSKDAMYAAAQKEAKMLTWILRAVGFFLMFIGISMVFRPLSVVADVVPIVGDILRMGTGILGFAIAAPLTLITIAVAWLVFRPVLGVVLLVVAVGAIVGIKVLAFRRAKAAGPA